MQWCGSRGLTLLPPVCCWLSVCVCVGVSRGRTDWAVIFANRRKECTRVCFRNRAVQLLVSSSSWNIARKLGSEKVSPFLGGESVLPRFQKLRFGAGRRNRCAPAYTDQLNWLSRKLISIPFARRSVSCALNIL